MFKIGDVIKNYEWRLEDWEFTIEGIDNTNYKGILISKARGHRSHQKYTIEDAWILISKKAVISHLPDFL